MGIHTLHIYIANITVNGLKSSLSPYFVASLIPYSLLTAEMSSSPSPPPETGQRLSVVYFYPGRDSSLPLTAFNRACGYAQ
jgi:hypothetical protein